MARKISETQLIELTDEKIKEITVSLIESYGSTEGQSSEKEARHYFFNCSLSITVNLLDFLAQTIHFANDKIDPQKLLLVYLREFSELVAANAEQIAEDSHA